MQTEDVWRQEHTLAIALTAGQIHHNSQENAPFRFQNFPPCAAVLDHPPWRTGHRTRWSVQTERLRPRAQKMLAVIEIDGDREGPALAGCASEGASCWTIGTSYSRRFPAEVAMGRPGPRAAPASSRLPCGKSPQSASESLGTFTCRNDTSGAILGSLFDPAHRQPRRTPRAIVPWGTLRAIVPPTPALWRARPAWLPYLVPRRSGTHLVARKGEI